LRLTGLVYRAHNPRWAFRANSGAGAALHGGRFNRAGVEALYTSLRVETAWLEAQQAFPFKAQPMTMCAYEVDCDDIVDLTDAAALPSLGVTPDDLACAWEDLAGGKKTPPSWTLADELIAAGRAGILVRSFAPGATATDGNAVFWRWTDHPPHKVAVIDHHGRLPVDAGSWR
jgi:RES domain-containing protein